LDDLQGLVKNEARIWEKERGIGLGKITYYFTWQRMNSFI
jgi:hypothetical protein